jgi:hypothetical protein
MFGHSFSVYPPKPILIMCGHKKEKCGNNYKSKIKNKNLPEEFRKLGIIIEKVIERNNCKIGKYKINV